MVGIRHTTTIYQSIDIGKNVITTIYLSIYVLTLGKMSPIWHWETTVSPIEIGSWPRSIYINRPRWRLWLFCTECVSIRIYAYLYAHLPSTLTPMTISHGMRIYTHLCVSIHIYRPRWCLWLSRTECVSIRIYAYLSPYRLRAFDRSLKKNMPGKLFFVFASIRVPMYCTYVICTRERRNISLIEDQLR